MEKREVMDLYRTALSVFILAAVGGMAMAAGLLWSMRHADAADRDSAHKPRVVYPKRTELDFEGTSIEGEVRNPGEFYFQYRPEEKFDSLVKRRKNFHREMLRDAVLSK